MSATSEILLRIGKVIRRHREALKLTQEEFADARGINRPHYGAIERGKQNLTLLNLARVAEGLGKPLSQLLREAENLDEHALAEPARPPRRGRPPGRKSGWR
jgi:transcriptional regulator with XRE-family HTH domain